jgi:hypothetical protein
MLLKQHSTSLEISEDGKKWALLDTSYRTIEDQAKEIIRVVSIYSGRIANFCFCKNCDS